LEIRGSNIPAGLPLPFSRIANYAAKTPAKLAMRKCLWCLCSFGEKMYVAKVVLCELGKHSWGMKLTSSLLKCMIKTPQPPLNGAIKDDWVV
jgi:hypothetical protein